MNIEEGKVNKGGVNSKPTSRPPEPPKGQGRSEALLLCCHKCGKPVPAPLCLCHECAAKDHVQCPHISEPPGINWPPLDLISEFDTSPIPEDIQAVLDEKNSDIIPEEEPVICEPSLRPCRVCGKGNPIGIPVCWDCDENFEHWPKNEEILRELLFMEHHCDAKYGDDGEMQCSKCLIDFRRDSAETIRDKIQKRNNERLKKFVEENPDFWGGINPGKLPNIIGGEGPCKCDGTGKHPIPGDLG